MALDTSVKVPLPEHGIAYKKVSGKVYVYFVTATYRNAKGQPTCDRSCIGRLDEESGKLIPNKNYYEIYLKGSRPMAGGVFDYGMFHVFENIVKELGIVTILRRYFPNSYKQILTAAQYMLSEGNVMSYIEDFCETHETFEHGIMTDTQCSKLFSSIKQEEILLFFREWMKQRKKDEYIAYDVTSISSYGKNIDELEWGYNRDKEKLPQINMGLYYGETSGLPLYYRVYPGSISDKAHLKYMVADNELTDSKKLKYVMDRGFYSSDNLNYLVSKGHRFVIALPSSLKYCRELINKHRNELINVSEYKLGKGLPYGKAYEVTELGFRMIVHLYYDPEKALKESEALYELVERMENDLNNMEEPPDRKLRYDKFFFINRSKDGKLAFVKNHKAIDEALAACGFFLIAETDFTKDSKEILNIYRTRDVVEKSFDDLKNDIDFKRLHAHSSETVSGKIFVSFISLIVRSYMLKHLADLNLTQKKVVIELDKIKVLKLTANAKPRLINPVSRFARDILNSLGVPCDNLCIG